MSKIFIYSNACERRLLDAKKFYNYFLKNNYQIVSDPHKADIIILFTCGVLDYKTTEALNLIKKFQKFDAELVVTGCVPAIDEKKLNQIFKGKIITTEEFINNPDKIDHFFSNIKVKFKDLEDAERIYKQDSSNQIINNLKQFINKVKFLENAYLKFRSYIIRKIYREHPSIIHLISSKPYYLQICWGCLGNCSYCAIKKAIGEIKSKTTEQCLSEFENGLRKGHREFIITTDDVGAYGKDIGHTLPMLLDRITDVPGNYRIDIRDINPVWVVSYINDLENILKKRKITSLGVPIQSGSTRILKLMQRYSDIEKIRKSLFRIKKSYPEIKLLTHIIIGFPTETIEEFQSSLNFIIEAGFDTGFVYTFSLKKGTKAEEINHKVPYKEIARRFKFAKKFLKKSGYEIIHLSLFEKYYFMFDKN